MKQIHYILFTNSVRKCSAKEPFSTFKYKLTSVLCTTLYSPDSKDFQIMRNGSDFPKKSFLSNLCPLNCMMTSSFSNANSSAVKMIKPLSPPEPDPLFRRGSLTLTKNLVLITTKELHSNTHKFKLNRTYFSIRNDLAKRARSCTKEVMIPHIRTT